MIYPLNGWLCHRVVAWWRGDGGAGDPCLPADSCPRGPSRPLPIALPSSRRLSPHLAVPRGMFRHEARSGTIATQANRRDLTDQSLSSLSRSRLSSLSGRWMCLRVWKRQGKRKENILRVSWSWVENTLYTLCFGWFLSLYSQYVCLLYNKKSLLS